MQNSTNDHMRSEYNGCYTRHPKCRIATCIISTVVCMSLVGYCCALPQRTARCAQTSRLRAEALQSNSTHCHARHLRRHHGPPFSRPTGQRQAPGRRPRNAVCRDVAVDETSRHHVSATGFGRSRQYEACLREAAKSKVSKEAGGRHTKCWFCLTRNRRL